jgi:hypothetical protein
MELRWEIFEGISGFIGRIIYRIYRSLLRLRKRGFKALIS